LSFEYFDPTGKAIEDFDRIDWCDREVDLVPDSDVWTRPDLLKAVYALGRELEQRGARVQAVKLPHNRESKTGADDYLLNHSVDDFGSLKRVAMKHGVFKLISGWWKEWCREAPASLTDAASTFQDPEPWAEDVDGLELFQDVKSLFSRYIVIPEHALIATTLWVLHSWTLDACYVSPILAITSPTKRCGKTKTLELLSVTVRRALVASNITPAATFRAIDKFSPTLLVDEADTFLANNDELRGVLNSSHYRPTAYVIRTAGDEHEPKQFSTWAAKAIASIGRMRDTLIDRSIVVALKRKTPGDKVARLVHRELTATAGPLREKLARWSTDVMAILSTASPALPEELDDRAADNWTPLLAIADLLNVGNDARAAALKLAGHGEDEAASTMLLADIDSAFKAIGDDALFSQEIVEHLVAMEERPWPEWSKGQPITARKVASLLKPFDIRPKQIWKDEETKRGYLLEQFAEAFSRYTAVRTVRTQSSQQVTTEIDPLGNEDPNGSDLAVNDLKQSVLTGLTDRNPQNGEEKISDDEEGGIVEWRL
jgi:putative DNA primase/helicase